MPLTLYNSGSMDTLGDTLRGQSLKLQEDSMLKV